VLGGFVVEGEKMGGAAAVVVHEGLHGLNPLVKMSALILRLGNWDRGATVENMFILGMLKRNVKMTVAFPCRVMSPKIVRRS